MNRESLASVGEVFDRTLQGHVDKGGMEADELAIYQHGVLIRPDGPITQRMLNEARATLSGTGASITIIQEEPGVQSMKVSFGDREFPADAEDVADELEAQWDALDAVWELFDDADWAVFFDTDEAVYEEGDT
jgi:hypothetical protein